MLTIFLCDDHQQSIDKYCKMITKCAERNQTAIMISTFNSAESLLYHLSADPNQADIIYLDILMGQINGIDAARQLRELGCDSEIIFLTISADYVFDAFDISPVQYLVKDATTPEKFEAVFVRAASIAEKKKTDMFICEAGGVKKIIAVKDISFFEIWKRVVMVHYLVGESFEFYGTMEQLENQMKSRNFIRVHRSYLVNLLYITKFQQQSIILKTGEVIPIGVTYMKTVKQIFSNYISLFKIYES